MKRIATWVFATIGGIVLLFSYKTSTEAVSPSAAVVATDGTTRGQGPATTGGTGATAPTSSGLTDGTYTGAAQNTRYGAVQVQITVSDGRVASATATQYPTRERRDQEINAVAIPLLQDESVGTTDGRIDMISGATFTSQGYLGSLQDAIDQARP